MKISNLSVDRPVAITMIILVIVLIGGVALTMLPLELTSDIEMPFLMITTSYSGGSPEEVEELVTRPIEQSVATLDGLDTLSTTSREGFSWVMLRLNYGTDLTEAKNDLRDLMAEIENRLPDSAETPRIRNFDPNAEPIMEISIAGMEAEQLKTIAEDSIQPELEKINGVAAAEISGGREREIKINIDQNLLEAYQISLDQIASVIRASNQDGGLGSVMVGEEEISVRAQGEFESVDDIRNLKIRTSAGDEIPLTLISKIEDSYKDVSSISYLNGRESVGLSIQKQGDSNIVSVANEVEAAVENLKQSYSDLEIVITSNNAEYIKDSLASVQQNFIIGGILAVIILYLFLRNISSTIVIATAIPTSILATFAIMFFTDLSINTITLGGIALGVGMIVDNSIVVLENIYRKRAKGLDRFKAAKAGSSEVATAIFASTLTTAAVFIPIVFVEDMMAELFTPMALTVSFSLFASLLVALTFIPMLSSKALKISHNENNNALKDKKYLNFYQNILKKALKNRYKILVGLIVFFIFFGSGIYFGFIPITTEYMPASDQGSIRVYVSMPDNSTIERSDQIAKEIYNQIKEIKEIENVTARVNNGRARFSIELITQDQRQQDVEAVAEAIRNKTAAIAGPRINVAAQSSMRGGSGSSIEVKISGSDLETLLNYGENAERLLNKIEGIRNTDLSLERGNPEIHVNLNRREIQNQGFTEREIITYAEMALDGSTVDQLTEAGEEIDIIIQLAEADRRSLNNLRNLKIFKANGDSVLLSQLAEIGPGSGFSAIERENQQRYITVSADTFERALGEVQEDVEKIMAAELNLPTNYLLSYGGEAQEMDESFSQLITAAVMAILLVYMVMAAQFESLIYPFVIMFTVPLSAAGAVIALIITGMSLSTYGMIGAIMLVGIVVNNAIVMIDYINNRKEKMNRREAILEAAPIRLRPILMTTLTTVLAMMPLAVGIGTGAETQQPLAVVVIGGLLFSTILTLIIIPVVYDIVDEFRNKVVNYLRRIVHNE
ncbi:hydrophobic/amphiphilic exporter-1, HAE1 family [Halanaerobium congolense]|uniref:Hydrophobic/amphiphilic exporter-1, HAE1 family n=1 Tax=Halanaerobium congolense TaxID=54121 RepID=A0A1G8M1C3_9FIRM|nr:efflux RND transporter permease subunit [Halanaerobium congolense]SDI61693.1 hydrophobic/amphiphilic exporter-1, HAE1 family [Halanaerobium congolense]SET34262.1 hydrophobic/amphiphilic exporter-1, HAE1 family [Halanaerobium congolense]